MRISSFTNKLVTVLAVLTVTGCAGLDGGENSAFAKSSKSQALAALERPNLTPKDLFASRLPKRQIKTLAVTGDSLSISLASELEKFLASKPGLGFTSLGKVSSGLARPDFFDWDRNMENLARRYRPDAVVVMLGTNDNKHLRQADGSQITYGTAEWDRAYSAKVKHIVEIIRSHNATATVFWLGAPVMADEDLNRDLRHINNLLRKTMASLSDCHYVDTWPVFATAGGGFAFSKPDVEGGAALRARDGIHLTTAGAQALAGRCLAALETRITWDGPLQGSAPLADRGV
jgi:hypothetical protein